MSAIPAIFNNVSIARSHWMSIGSYLHDLETDIGVLTAEAKNLAKEKEYNATVVPSYIQMIKNLEKIVADKDALLDYHLEQDDKRMDQDKGAEKFSYEETIKNLEKTVSSQALIIEEQLKTIQKQAHHINLYARKSNK